MGVKTSFSNLCTALKTVLENKVDNTKAGANSLLSKMPTWTQNPKDNVYFIRQDVDSKEEFGKAKFSTLWNYIKSKADASISTVSTNYVQNKAVGLKFQGVDSEIRELAEKVADTGWKTTGNLKYRKSCYIIALQGTVTPSGSTMSITLGTLPKDCRPSQDINIAQASTDTPSRQIIVQTDGNVVLLFSSNCTASHTYAYNGIFMI